MDTICDPPSLLSAFQFASNLSYFKMAYFWPGLIDRRSLYSIPEGESCRSRKFCDRFVSCKVTYFWREYLWQRIKALCKIGDERMMIKLSPSSHDELFTLLCLRVWNLLISKVFCVLFICYSIPKCMCEALLRGQQALCATICVLYSYRLYLGFLWLI